MGFGVAVSLLIDATLIRLVLLPAAMQLLGDRNWYLPGWLGWLPHLEIEGRTAGSDLVVLAPSSLSWSDFRGTFDGALRVALPRARRVHLHVHSEFLDLGRRVPMFLAPWRRRRGRDAGRRRDVPRLAVRSTSTGRLGRKARSRCSAARRTWSTTAEVQQKGTRTWTFSARTNEGYGNLIQLRPVRGRATWRGYHRRRDRGAAGAPRKRAYRALGLPRPGLARRLGRREKDADLVDRLGDIFGGISDVRRAAERGPPRAAGESRRSSPRSAGGAWAPARWPTRCPRPGSTGLMPSRTSVSASVSARTSSRTWPIRGFEMNGSIDTSATSLRLPRHEGRDDARLEAAYAVRRGNPALLICCRTSRRRRPRRVGSPRRACARRAWSARRCTVTPELQERLRFEL